MRIRSHPAPRRRASARTARPAAAALARPRLPRPHPNMLWADTVLPPLPPMRGQIWISSIQTIIYRLSAPCPPPVRPVRPDTFNRHGPAPPRRRSPPRPLHLPNSRRRAHGNSAPRRHMTLGICLVDVKPACRRFSGVARPGRGGAGHAPTPPRPPLGEADLVVGQAEEPVHPLIDLPIRRVNLALDRRLRVNRLVISGT